MKTDISIRLRLTLSKIAGVVVLLAGIYGFIFSKNISESVFVIGLGAGMIGYKQYLTSKTTEKND